MVRVKYHQLSETQKEKYLDDFYKIVSLLKSPEEIKKFFNGLITSTELVMICRRIQVAEMLARDATYQMIKGRLGVANTTVRYVNHWFYDHFNDYQKILKQFNEIKEEKEKTKESWLSPELTAEIKQLVRRYPADFALLGLLMGMHKKKSSFNKYNLQS